MALIDKITRTPAGQLKQAAVIDSRQILFRNLIEKQGLKIRDAAQIVGYSKDYGYKLTQKFKAEGNQVSRQLPEDIAREIDKRAKMLLQGKTWGKIKEVRCSTVANLINAGWSRMYPAKQEGAGGDTFNFTQINLAQIETAAPPAIDALYCGLPHNGGLVQHSVDGPDATTDEE